MREIADRYRRVAGGFTQRADAVPGAAWDSPAPCEGWVARDVVRHLVEWVPAFLEVGAAVDLPTGPSVDVDPARAWSTMSDGVQALLDDPNQAGRPFRHPNVGDHRLDEAIGTFILGDVLVHTWDLARATGLDDTLDADEAAAAFAGMEGIGDVLVESGQYGPRVEVDADASVQAQLIAFVGRDPNWSSPR